MLLCNMRERESGFPCLCYSKRVREKKERDGERESEREKKERDIY